MEILDKVHIESIDFIGNQLSIAISGKNYNWSLSEVSEKLLNASDTDRRDFIISPSGYGIHWPKLNEDLSIHGLIKNKD